jgi:hypothetical protein
VGFLVHHDVEQSWLFFRWRGPKKLPLCREHLVERLRADFLAADQHMIVFCPDRGERRNGYQYTYHTVKEVRQLCNVKGPDREIPAIVQSWLNAIAGNCVRCGVPAQIAFFPARALPWDEAPRSTGVLVDQPLLREVREKPEALCRACAVGEICQVLRTTPAEREFDEGIFSPLGCAEGIMLTTEPVPFG